MYTISGSGNREFVGFASIRAIVGKVTDPYADYLVYDSFTGSDGTALTAHTPEKAPGAWTNYNTNPWTIQGNKAATGGGASRQNMAIESGGADVVITGDVLAQQTSLVSRLSDTTHLCFCLAHATADQIRLYTDNAGFAVIGSAAKVYTAGDPVSFIYAVNGNAHSAQDGAVTATATSAFNNTATKHGLWADTNTAGWTVDNFTVSAA